MRLMGRQTFSMENNSNSFLNSWGLKFGAVFFPLLWGKILVEYLTKGCVQWNNLPEVCGTPALLALIASGFIFFSIPVYVLRKLGKKKK